MLIDPCLLQSRWTFRTCFKPRQEEIWQKKLRVLQKSIASLENSQLTRDMVATQTQLLEAATKLFPSPGGKLPPV